MATFAAGHLSDDVRPANRRSGASLAPVNPLPGHADSADASSGHQMHGPSSQASGSPHGIAPATAPALPRDVMLAIVRTALAAEGYSLHAWARLSLVCGAWRRELRGAPRFVAALSAPSTPNVMLTHLQGSPVCDFTSLTAPAC